MRKRACWWCEGKQGKEFFDFKVIVLGTGKKAFHSLGETVSIVIHYAYQADLGECLDVVMSMLVGKS